jgi:hypothetical protein
MIEHRRQVRWLAYQRRNIFQEILESVVRLKHRSEVICIPGVIDHKDAVFVDGG